MIILFFHFYSFGLIASTAIILSLVALTFLCFRQRAFNRYLLQLSIESIKKNLLGDYVTLGDAVKVVENLMREINSSKERSREKVKALLKENLAANSVFLGVWIAYEFNEFDGKDSALGRMRPYFYRKEGRISHISLENLEQEEFYTKPMKTGKMEILDPFNFAIEGKNVLMTTVAAPIKRKRETIGVIGVDVALKEAKTIYRDLVFTTSRYEDQSGEALIERLMGNVESKVLGFAIDAGKKNQSEMVGILSDAARSLTESSVVLEEMNKNLSTRVFQQASSLEEISATIEELVSTISQNTNHALEAEKLSKGSEGKAAEGGQVLQDAIAAIEEINNSSKRIEEVITLINDIAFQTNLLALNAAVEAARAGEEGLGFAVVASEVRNLAQRAANSVDEIRELIKDTIDKVDRGTILVKPKWSFN